MIADWETSNKLAHLDSAKKVANATRSLPPHLKSQRAQAQRVAKEEEKKRARREEVLAKAKAKGRGKGKGGGAKAKGGRANGKGGKAAAQPQVVLDDDDDDDDERPLSDRRRPPADVAGRVAAAKETALKREHAAEVHALQQQLTAAKAVQLQPQMSVQQVLPQAPAGNRVLNSPAPPPPLQAHSTLPAGWRSAMDPAGRRYYYNKSLNTSTYDMPEADSPPLPPPSAPSVAASDKQQASQGSASSNTGASYSFESFEASQRRSRITYIKGYLPLCENKLEKAELQGELAVLQREEHVYKHSQDPLAARLF